MDSEKTFELSIPQEGMKCMLTLIEKGQLLLQMLPWILLAITWMLIYVKYEERKEARKEQNNG